MTLNSDLIEAKISFYKAFTVVLDDLHYYLEDNNPIPIDIRQRD